MKHRLSLRLTVPALLGLLMFALSPAFAQQAAQPAQQMGKIHGQVINPTGQVQTNGTVSLASPGSPKPKYEFPVDSDGNFSGEAAPGTYSLIYREPNTPPGQMVDEIMNVKVIAGQDIQQNIDMTRPEYLAKMTPEQRKQLEEIKKENASALKANQIIKQLNGDLKAVTADKHDIDLATQTAAQQLGASATKAQVQAKVAEIKAGKYTDIETMMTKDTQLKPDEPILWTNLGYAEAGLQKYDQAITSYQKALDLEKASKKPRAEILGVAQAGLGEVYARTGKVPQANAAYDAAAQADPAQAGLFLKNEAIIFFQQGNAKAQAAAADEAIKANPNDPILYYLKGQALVQNATIDPKTQRIVLPPDCLDAYKKYMELAPNGPFAPEVAGILQQAGEKVSSSYSAHGKKR